MSSSRPRPYMRSNSSCQCQKREEERSADAYEWRSRSSSTIRVGTVVRRRWPGKRCQFGSLLRTISKVDAVQVSEIPAAVLEEDQQRTALAVEKESSVKSVVPQGGKTSSNVRTLTQTTEGVPKQQHTRS